MDNSNGCVNCNSDDDTICEQCAERWESTLLLQQQMDIGFAAQAAASHFVKYNVKRPKRDSRLTGSNWVWEQWHGHDDRFYEVHRMRKPAVRTLIQMLVNDGGMNPNPKHVTLEESVAIFLQITGQGVPYPTVEERVQRSSETISNHFHMVLDAVCKLGNKLINPPDPNFREDPEQLVNNKKAWPAFKGCIGAIDGIHIQLHIPDAEKVPWMNRKGVSTTNVLAICDFSMCFIFATVGMEGSMHDSRVLEESMTDPRRNFPFPPEGKFYLADAGYPLMRGFLTPYRGTRYHIPEFRSNPNLKNENEAFNYRHSSLRSMIERSFGILKKRWRILSNMPLMSIETQIKVIWACMALHNFVRRYDADDLDELERLVQRTRCTHTVTMSSTIRSDEGSQWRRVGRNEANEMETFRNNVRRIVVHGE